MTKNPFKFEAKSFKIIYKHFEQKEKLVKIVFNHQLNQA